MAWIFGGGGWEGAIESFGAARRLSGSFGGERSQIKVAQGPRQQAAVPFAL